MENTKNVMDQQVAELLQFIKSGLEKTSDFAIEQAPIVCREIVNWVFYYNLSILIMLAVVICLYVYGFRKLLVPIVKKYNDSGDDDDFGVLVVSSIIFGFSGLVLMFACLSEIPRSTAQCIKSSVAPRLVIIDYVTESVK